MTPSLRRPTIRIPSLPSILTPTGSSRPVGAASNGPVLDLLREQRNVLGHEALSATLAQRGSLLRRGLLIGLGLLAGAAGIASLLLLQTTLLRSQLAQLQHYEAEAADLKTQLQQRNLGLASIRATNKQLAEALTSGRTSSALLAALQLNTPEGVQLVSVDASGATLVVKGLAYDPLALVRINALQLQLSRTALFDAKGVELTKVERQPSQAPTGAAEKVSAAPPPPGPLAFEIHAPFASLDANRQLALMQQFGSEGMARRLQLLRSEGLMP